jgi:hypothetical protein
MPDCFLSVAEGSADRLRLPHSSNDTNRLAILDSDGPKKLIGLTQRVRAQAAAMLEDLKDRQLVARPEAFFKVVAAEARL